MSSTATNCDAYNQNANSPLNSSDSKRTHNPSEIKHDSDESTSTNYLHAEHDIGKLKVLQSSGNDTMAKKYAMSVMAASVAETVTYPLDLTKTRLQLQGEVASGEVQFKYRGMLRTALGIVKDEGLLMLWRGMLPALYRHAIYTGIRMTAYEEIRTELQRTDKNGFPLWKKVVAGMTAGGVGQLVASPTDLIKTQIQMEGKRRLQGKPPRVKGMMDAFQKIVAQGGIAGLWRGCWPNVQRAALVNLGDLSTYDTIKRKLLQNTNLKDNSVTHCLSSACAGLVGAIMGTPADVVKARIMNQPTDSNGKGIRNFCSFQTRTCHYLGTPASYSIIIAIFFYRYFVQKLSGLPNQNNKARRIFCII